MKRFFRFRNDKQMFSRESVLSYVIEKSYARTRRTRLTCLSSEEFDSNCEDKYLDGESTD